MQVGDVAGNGPGRHCTPRRRRRRRRLNVGRMLVINDPPASAFIAIFAAATTPS
jgi:hypothetical protein